MLIRMRGFITGLIDIQENINYNRHNKDVLKFMRHFLKLSERRLYDVFKNVLIYDSLYRLCPYNSLDQYYTRPFFVVQFFQVCRLAIRGPLCHAAD